MSAPRARRHRLPRWTRRATETGHAAARRRVADAIAAAFDSDESSSRIEAIHEETKKHEKVALRELGEYLAQADTAEVPARAERDAGAYPTLWRETLNIAVCHLVEDLKADYASLPNVIEFLDQVWHDVVDAGAADEKGIVPRGSINYRVALQLAEFAALRRSFAAMPHERRTRRGPKREAAARKLPGA